MRWEIVTYWRFAMTPKAKFKSDAFEAIHSAATGLRRAGTIDSKDQK
ncbi:MAG: hypothetical protein ABI699_05160 [Caldimonas sp.]